jgi:hypothetical protein
MSIAESLPYRSRVSKLLRFFCRSRDKWKAKSKEAKRENKSLKYPLAKMKESRDRWDRINGGRASLFGRSAAIGQRRLPKQTLPTPQFNSRTRIRRTFWLAAAFHAS